MAPSVEAGAHPTSDTGTLPGIAGDAGVPDVDGWWQEVNNLDVAAYAAIAATPTPVLDGVFRRLSRCIPAGTRNHFALDVAPSRVSPSGLAP